MRKIKFRGKTIDGKWIFGYLIKQGAYYFIQNESGGNDTVIESTIGQFTGLQDKNGKDIYENDIVYDKIQNSTVRWNSREVKFNLEIIYPDSPLDIHQTHKNIPLDGLGLYIKGNIHE